MASSNANSEDGVFELLTELCSNIASKYCSQNRISQKRLASKMRTHSYEIILKKTTKEIPTSDRDPVVDSLSYYFVSQQNARNVAEYKRCTELKKVISTIRQKDFGENKDNVHNVLKFLVGMSNSIKEDLSPEMYQSPFSFGIFNEMLPKPPRETFGSAQPYPYYPSHVFELPFSLRRQGGDLGSQKSQTYTEYTVESFDSKSLITDTASQMKTELKTFLSPMTLSSMTSTHLDPYSESGILNYPRLTGPRDLRIPPSPPIEPNVKVSFMSTVDQSHVKEVFRAETDNESLDIWELATQIDKDVPDDIWDIVSKLPPINERQLIASSPRELSLWKRIHADRLSQLDIITEKQFIRHIMYLIIGVETSSFPYNPENGCFVIRSDLALEGVSPARLRHYAADLLLVGTYYRRLFQFAFNHSLDDQFHNRGLVYEAAREVTRRYLLEFRLKATEIYEECCKSSSESINCMPTLLQISYHMEPLKYEIETIVSIYKMVDPESRSSIPQGAELMSYLFSEISMVTHRTTAHTLFTSLFSICKVYFKFIERFIFEGELDDRYHEFFIRKDSQYVNCRSKRYWDKGFHIAHSVAVPGFLRALAKYILLCGKSLRLLKLCNPTDPLVLLISSDHPSIKCCDSFSALERQQQVLDVYRTRCLFVSGEPVTFHQILLKRDAERKAFTEMASLKQAETLEKIVAERARLAQLIVAEKQHSLRALQAAREQARAQRLRARRRARRPAPAPAPRAAGDLDERLRADERDKIMEYYSKLNMEVEKSKIHTEWKIKRLQLDESRMQLLSTEERNLKREKLELEHQRNEEMAMSIQSIDYNNDDSEKDVQEINPEMTESGTSIVEEMAVSSHEDDTKSDVFSVICNAAKSIFGVSKSDENCDNKKKLDAQGNILTADIEKEPITSSEVIGSKLDSNYDNQQFLKMRQEANLNKQKVMAHEFGQLDTQNNQMREPPVDEENNVEDIWSTFAEAKRNKLKVLGAEFGGVKPEAKQAEPRTDAQKEALINKQKVLGVEYNLPIEFSKRNPATEAQEEAVKNRNKVLGSEQNKFEGSQRRERSGLTLNLKPYGDTPTQLLPVTPSAGAVTPGEFYSRLDLETPTTADVPLESALTSDVFTPRSEGSKDVIDSKNTEKGFISAEGFNFPVIVDDDAVEVIGDVQTEDTPDNSPSKSVDIDTTDIRHKLSFSNILDGSYNLDQFDPFGVRDLKSYSKDHFTSKMDVQMSSSCYTHPAVIMDEVKKRPYTNIFASHFEEEKEEKITSDNIATLTACLQRSVMLPLTYQLEVVNNSILTYFLVNLDMYEHLKSLKDYFFLMDGEFSRSICHNLFAKLTKTLNPQELLNFATLHNILDKALGSSISHVHKFSENLSFSFTEPPLSFQHSSADALQCLSLTYAVRWPLSIILSHEALLRYAKVFQFLIKMRRIFWVLGEDFEALKLTAKKMPSSRRRRLLRSPQYIAVQLQRHVMAALLRALDHYIVTTCILTSWTEFENDLKKARTLDDLYECHVAYIKKVVFRCLLNNRSTPVMKLLNDIFTVILKFSRVLRASEWQHQEPNGYFTHPSFAQLQELHHLFEKLAKYLHKVVGKLTECGYQRHLVELLTMVNLNGYYDPERKEPANVSAPTIVTHSAV